LEDLSAHELEIGCRRLLRRWNYTTMPPPAYIRECVAGAMEEERDFNSIHKERRPELPRLTVEQAWAEWEECLQINKMMREKFGIIERKQNAELKKVYTQDLVLARPERLAELEKQKEEVLEKYGKRTTVRVRDSAPPEGDQGTGGEK